VTAKNETDQRVARSRDALREIVGSFGEEIGRPPTLGELLEVLSWASGASGPSPVRFEARTGTGGRYEAPAGSLVGDLNDAVFAEASTMLAELAETAGDDTPKVLARLLGEAIRTSWIVLGDVGADDKVTISAKATAMRAKPKVGDVVAVPSAHGGHHLAVVVAQNRFGTALGLVRRSGAAPGRALPRLPFYTDDVLVRDGTWKVLGQDRALLARFPEEPEVFHPPDIEWPGIDLGEFGAAESLAGSLRLLDEAEARDVGLLDGSYERSRMGEGLQRFWDEV
jgi:hypothetical protein